MSRKNLYTFLGILFLLANAFAFWLGRYHTIYGVGIYMLPSIWIYALAPALIFLAVKFKKRKNFFLVYLVSANFLFLVYFTLFGIDRYKPTVKIIAPENFEGCVYLFHTDEVIDEVIIDKNGIGYLERKNVIYEFYIGDEEVEIKNAGFNMPMLWNDDSTFYNAVRVECYDLSYPNQENYARDGCMNWEEYQELIEIGWVDPNRVKDYSRALEESELLQRKINKQFRMFWPTNLQRGSEGEMIGRPIHEKIYGYLTFKYDTLSSEIALDCGFKQTFKKGFTYHEWSCDSIKHVKIEIRKTPYYYTKKLFAQFFQVQGYTFNNDNSKYYSLVGDGPEYFYDIKQENDSVFVEIKYPL